MRYKVVDVNRKKTVVNTNDALLCFRYLLSYLNKHGDDMILESAGESADTKYLIYHAINAYGCIQSISRDE